MFSPQRRRNWAWTLRRRDILTSREPHRVASVRERERDIQIDRHRQTDEEREGETEADRQAGRQAGRQTDR